MPDKPDDRPKTESTKPVEDPKIFIVVNGEKFPRPPLQTLFVSPEDSTEGTTDSTNVAGIYCSCNKVGSCTCVGHVGQVESPSGGGYGVRTGCRCAPVH